MSERLSAMTKSTIDVECDFCGEVAPVVTVQIRPGKAEARTFQRFTTADICLDCARMAVALLEDKNP